ncbi:hypothetical protein STEG23_007327, partial [Scotinomys teguina]
PTDLPTAQQDRPHNLHPDHVMIGWNLLEDESIPASSSVPQLSTNSLLMKLCAEEASG